MNNETFDQILVPMIGPCFGDSGGPLVCVENKTAVLTGIVSYVKGGCSVVWLPAVFTKVFGFLQWILPFTVFFKDNSSNKFHA